MEENLKYCSHLFCIIAKIQNRFRRKPMLRKYSCFPLLIFSFLAIILKYLEIYSTKYKLHLIYAKRYHPSKRTAVLSTLGPNGLIRTVFASIIKLLYLD